jgi:enolase
MLELDGTPNKCHLGANSMLGVSLAVARAAAASVKMPLYRYLGGPTATELPVPMVNILSGGVHGGDNFDFQDFLVVPLRTRGYAKALEDVAAVFLAMRDVLKDRGIFQAGAADEGGYAPRLESNEAGFALMVEAIERAGLRPGEDAAIAVDLAASQFGQAGTYSLAVEGLELSSMAMVDRLAVWVDRYPILSIEDGMGEDDWNGWRELTRRLGTCCQLVTDDLTATNLLLLKKAIDVDAGNAVLVKMNQVGTLTETLEVLNLARQHGYWTVVSARSGETEDDLLADLAVATTASQIKVGSITRSERLAKYNRLLRIEEELGPDAVYRGEAVFRDHSR